MPRKAILIIHNAKPLGSFPHAVVCSIRDLTNCWSISVIIMVIIVLWYILKHSHICGTYNNTVFAWFLIQLIVPGPPENLTVQVLNFAVTISWQPPLQANGIITNYTITYNGSRNGIQPVSYVRSSNTRTYVLCCGNQNNVIVSELLYMYVNALNKWMIILLSRALWMHEVILDRYSELCGSKTTCD